ncbi:hypothetical protein NE865_01621 [Phthorimaea operculella]|nr:hypothetical protein NE865_01621 [Phthorimaea operculella]
MSGRNQCLHLGLRRNSGRKAGVTVCLQHFDIDLASWEVAAAQLADEPWWLLNTALLTKATIALLVEKPLFTKWAGSKVGHKSRRYDLRPRVLDTEASSYEQPWRSVEPEPIMHKSTEDIWGDSSERPLKRRKGGRKRKRRPYVDDLPHEEHTETIRSEPAIAEMPLDIHPYPEASEDKHVVHRYHETDEPLRYRETQYAPTTEMPKRRRRRPDNRRNRWTEDYLDIERPLKRRVQRRKRPSADSSPKLSEFAEFRVEEEAPRLPDYPPEPDKPYDYADEDRTEQHQHYLHMKGNNLYMKEDSLSASSSEKTYPPETTTTRQENLTTAAEDEQGMDINEDSKGLEKEPSDRASDWLEKLRGDQPIDPETLKQILKRSNGASLSEILQKNNLSLADLLRSKQDYKSMAKQEEQSNTDQNSQADKPEPKEINKENNLKTNERINVETYPEPKEIISATEVAPDNKPVRPPETNTNKPSDLESQSTGVDKKQQNNEVEIVPKIATTRRTGVRRKLRMRPPTNGQYKQQLNRDLMAQTARKYHNSRNMTKSHKSKEWKYVIPMMNTPNSSEEISNNRNEVIETTTSPETTTTTTVMPEETTTTVFAEFENPTTIQIPTDTEDEDILVEKETTIFISTTQETTTTEATTTTEKPKVSRLRPGANRMGLRRQAFNHRLKRKRMKQKSTTTEPSVREEYNNDFFGNPNLVSSSEFIARTQTPKPATADHIIIDEDFTTLDDFMTTEKYRHSESGPRFTRNSSISDEDIEPTRSVTIPRFVSTTEETAKFEIEEILNDTRTSARLSRILMERNMTLNELVEHRERGSSHVHLADIFHNASKEPNPPEPFLTKSSIEPISKETYPLRAILEANLHDSAAKASTADAAAQTYAGNIPVVMDFGNNVNENGENMGIMSLFNKFTDDLSSIEESTTGKDSEGTPYVTTVIAVNNTKADANETTTRESRVLKNEENNLKNDVVGWNELLELMRKNHLNETDDLALDRDSPSDHQHIVLEDSDGDGLIVLEDLQRLKDLNINTGERLDINSYESDAAAPGILDRSPSHSRSVTVATASIVGLAMILFLLTYAAFKWKQQRNMLRKKQNFPDDRIPTPVFENRKSNKMNSSTRSISPMLATSNIYSLNTLDSNGKESPDYMWDSLRKPFQ